MLDNGITCSLTKLENELLMLCGRTFKTNKTQLIFTPSSFFEYAGLDRHEFIKPEELRALIASIDTKLAPSKFVEFLYKAIENRVENLNSLTPETFKAKFEDKLPYLPSDSQEFVKMHFIKELRNPTKMAEIRQNLAFHLHCSSAVPEKHVSAHHLLGTRTMFAHFKSGNTLSVAKHLPRTWQRMRRSKELVDMSTEYKKALAAEVSMHETRDNVDSDLVHLAVTGVVRHGIPWPVYCITEDSCGQVKHRVMLYKSMIRTFAQCARKTGEKEYKNLDFKCGRVIFVDKNLKGKSEAQVQKLKKVLSYSS